MELSSSRAAARIDLQGGRLASLTIDGLEVLITEGDKASRWGSFPMVPWAGRLPFGKLDFDGESHNFPITSPPHANHGVGHLQRWEEAVSTSDSGTITTALADPWPFGGHATQHFVLTDTSLTVTITVTNDDRTMPALTGWHPWFRRQLDQGGPAQLAVEPSQAYALDDDMIPTGEMKPVPEPPWNETFVGLAAPAVIEWPGALLLEVSSTFDHWVIFTEPDHALCVEPQSGPPNQVNTDPFVVGPDNPLSGSMTLRWDL